MKNTIIFLDGRMVKADKARLKSLSPGIVSGRGVFETMRLCQGRIFALEDHLSRMSRGLGLFKFRVPYPKKRMKEYLYQTARRNHLGDARVRLAAWKEGKRFRISVVCEARPAPSRDKYEQGFTAAVSEIRRNKTKFSHIKSIDYHPFRQALLKARSKGCDEAILLNNRGQLVEGATTNIFFVKNKVLYTPAVRCGCLNGITRQIIIKCAREAGISCKAVMVGITRLRSADEAFLTNSLMGVMPLTVLDGRFIGNGKIGQVTGMLLNAYRELAENRLFR